MEEEGTFPKFILYIQHYFIARLYGRQMKRKLQASVSDKKQTTKILSNVLLTELDSHWKGHAVQSSEIYPWDAGTANACESINTRTTVTKIVKVLITQVMSDSFRPHGL